jgi:hypothetical protein
MIDINFTTKPDYSALNPPKFVKCLRLYNTVLIPKEKIINLISPGDTIQFLINNKPIKQKAALDCGFINLYDQEYYFFYIVPGFEIDKIDKKYQIIVDNQNLPLKTYIDPTYSAKIINGLLILENNYNYLFNHTNYSIVSNTTKNIFTTITKKQNKYNYYMANNNNTILHILDDININTLYEINNTFNDILIKPIFNIGFPLGKAIINSEGVSYSRLKFGTNIHNFRKNITVDYLPKGKYNISVLDTNNKPLIIRKLNGIDFEKDNFDIEIGSVIHGTEKISSIETGYHLDKPIKNLSNLLINIYPYNTKFKIFGPNNFFKQFETGYQKLTNIHSGNYKIEYSNKQHTIFVIKNDNNYFSNIN